LTQKRVLILTADAGFGHRSAAEAVEAALAELYGDQCVTKVVNPLDEADAPELIRQLEEGYDEMVVEDPALYRIAYHAMGTPLVADIVEAFATRLLNDVMLRLVQDFQPHVVVSTYPTYAQPVALAIKETTQDIALAVVITDLTDVQSLWYSRAATMHFVPTSLIRQQAYDNKIPATRVWVTGLPVHPAIARETRDPLVLRDTLGWMQEIPTGLIVASARTQQMATISRLLDRAQIVLQLAVVCGGDGELFRRLQQVQWHGPVHLYDWVDNMPQMMKAADFIVSKAGGLIVSESLACGLPMIISEALPGQEVGNVRYVVENEAGTWAPGPAEVLATAFSWLKGTPPQLDAVRANAVRLGKPRAAYDIAEGVWGLA